MTSQHHRKHNDDNRRHNKRIYSDIDVTAYINDEEYLTKMRNISGNGMQIIEPSDVDLQSGQDCEILVQYENTSIKIEALVVWKDFGLIGLCFKKQNQSLQKQLNKLSEKLSQTAVTDMDMADLV